MLFIAEIVVKLFWTIMTNSGHSFMLLKLCPQLGLPLFGFLSSKKIPHISFNHSCWDSTDKPTISLLCYNAEQSINRLSAQRKFHTNIGKRLKNTSRLINSNSNLQANIIMKLVIIFAALVVIAAVADGE